MEDLSVNIPRVYTIVAEVMSCWVYFIIYKRKISIGKIVLLTGCVGLAELLYAQASAILSSWFWPIHMFFLFSFMFGYMYCVIDRSALTVFLLRCFFIQFAL